MNETSASGHNAADRIEPRFAFGTNWSRFIRLIDEERISAAEQALRSNLGDLRGLRFVDIGSGSGLMSLAAHRQGASVYSFDYDQDSVQCTTQLRNTFEPDGWTVAQGSILDAQFVGNLGHFDVVYAWGVLHHTGGLWQALDNAASLVAPGGRLFVAIYNDQGLSSLMWRRIKRLYCSAPYMRPLILAGTVAYWELNPIRWGVRLLRGKSPFLALSSQPARGMARWTDLVDWVGGYPFEVAKPDEVVDRLVPRGLNLLKLRTVGSGHGCNEYIFRLEAHDRPTSEAP